MSSTSTPTSESDSIQKTLTALYTINKKAAEYADRASDQYRSNKKSTAHKNSLRKKALYSLKTDVLKRLYDRDQHKQIEVHEIDDRNYYCLYFNGVSFHSPTDTWSGEIPTDEIESETKLDNFEKEGSAESGISLKDSLIHLKDEFGSNFNANEHLEEEYVDYAHRSYYIGWKYL
jgi:hypothetical protein